MLQCGRASVSVCYCILEGVPVVSMCKDDAINDSERPARGLRGGVEKPQTPRDASLAFHDAFH